MKKKGKGYKKPSHIDFALPLWKESYFLNLLPHRFHETFMEGIIFFSSIFYFVVPFYIWRFVNDLEHDHICEFLYIYNKVIRLHI